MRLKTEQGSITTGFLNLDKDGRKRIYAEAAALFSDDLKKKVHEIIQWTTSRREVTTMQDSGDFFDEKYFRDKFAYDPAQARALQCVSSNQQGHIEARSSFFPLPISMEGRI